MTSEELKAIPKGSDIYFKGKKYYWLCWRNGSAPLCTREQYENFEFSDGYIYANGISRFGEKIGEISDITGDASVARRGLIRNSNAIIF